MSSKFSDAMSRMFDWQDTVELLQYDFVQQALDQIPVVAHGLSSRDRYPLSNEASKHSDPSRRQAVRR